MNALWIDLPADAMNVAAAFRLALEIPSGETATMRIAAADFYRLWVDGRIVVHGPARAAHGHARVDEITLRGTNSRLVLFVEVLSMHVPCFDGVEQDAFFAAEIVAADGRVLATTSDFVAWRDETLIQRVRRSSFQRGFVESRRMAADPGDFRRGGDAPEGWTRIATVPRPLPSLLPRGVSYPALAFHDAGAPTSRFSTFLDEAATPPECSEVALVVNGKCKGFLQAEWEDDSALDAAQLTANEKDCTECSHYPFPSVLHDFGRILAGFLSLRVRAAAPMGATILVTFDEILTPEGARNPVDPFRGAWTRVLKWRLAPGDYDLLAFQPATVRYAAVTVLEGVADIAHVGLVDFENPDKSRAALPPTGDATLDAIVAAARETFAQNAVDVLTDCPARERAGWLFDSFFTGRAEALFTGRNLVERAFLENYALAPKIATLPDGMIPMCYPAEFPGGSFIANWSLWWLLELGQYRDRTGDEEIVAASRAKVEGLLDWFMHYENEDGLLVDIPGWVFVEWSPCNDKDHVCGVNFPSNFLYAAALDAAGALLGDSSLAARAAAVRENAARLSWNGEWFEDNAVRGGDGILRLAGHVTETGQYYPLYFGAASPETHPALWMRLCNEFGPKRDAARTWPDIPPSDSIPGVYLRLELLLRYGRQRQCLDECRDIFGPMACLTGTLWEHLRPGDSMDHGFAASAAWLIFRALQEKGRR